MAKDHKYEKIPIGRAKDLTGKKFGKLTVLYRIKVPYKDPYWLCECECGNQKAVRASHLISGQVKTCNQCNYENLLGQRFGKLTVIRDLHKKSKDGKHLWECKCDCGNIITVRGANLKSGNTNSCGCYQKNQAKEKNKLQISIGKRYGLLTILEEIEVDEKNRRCFKCQCDCGNIIITNIRALQNGERKSCGCINSIGQAKIVKILNYYKIPFVQEKVFDNFKYPDTQGCPRFDFYINNQYLIEYDGNIHFEENIKENTWNNEEEFQKRHYHDLIKNEYCQKNNIPLIRIPYTHLDTLCIEDLQLKTTQFRVV